MKWTVEKNLEAEYYWFRNEVGCAENFKNLRKLPSELVERLEANFLEERKKQHKQIETDARNLNGKWVNTWSDFLEEVVITLIIMLILLLVGIAVYKL